MDLASIGSLVTSIGIPGAFCILLAWYVKKQTDDYRTDVKEIQREHKEEISKVTEALNNNTLALQKLVDKMDNLNA